MSDRDYVEIFKDGDVFPVDEDTRRRIALVVASAREDIFAEPLGDTVREWIRQDGRQAAARDIRALVAQGASEKEAEYYARIAEGGQEVAPPE